MKDAFYSAPKYAGIACGIKNVGIGNGMPDAGQASSTVDDDDTIDIRTGFTEMGQGFFTVLVQSLCEDHGHRPAPGARRDRHRATRRRAA